MTLPLHDFQRAAADSLKAAILAGQNPLYVAGTGSGKTRTLSAVVQELDLPTIWLVHRKELVEQAYDTLRNFGLSVGYAMAGRPMYAARQVLVGTFGTVGRRDVNQRRLVVADEAHRSVAKTHAACIDRFPDAYRTGGTATPYRLDGRGLGSMFGALVEAPREAELIARGFLIEPKAFSPPPVSVAGVKTLAGDYNRAHLARLVDKPKLIGDAVATWQEHANGYLTIAFAVSVEHSKHLAAAFNAAGIRAAHCDADTPKDERDALVKAFARREILVLCNVELFTEGFDVPGVECVSVNRPTASLALHRQMLGRATRVLAGKRHPVVLDHAGNMPVHGRITRLINFSLEGGAQPADPTGLRTCPRCFRMCDARRARCPECGVEFALLGNPRDAMPETVDGTLEEYREQPAVKPQRDASPADRAAYFQSLCAESARAGWTLRQIEEQYKRRFGVKPCTVEIAGRVHLATKDSPDDVKAAAFTKFADEGRRWQKPIWWPHKRFSDTFGHRAEDQHKNPHAPQKTLFQGAA